MKKTIFILFFIPLCVCSQVWENNLLKKNPDATFYERKMVFDDYRNQYPDYKGYNPYARQLDFIEKRLDKNGIYPEDKLYRQWQKEKLKYNNYNFSSSSNWQELGPFFTAYTLNGGYPVGNGRVNTIEFDPFDPNIIWVGAASGGLWKTVDGGNNWTTNTDNLPVISISSITINPSNTQEMLIATGDAIHGAYTSSIGVLRSTDGGMSWDTTGLDDIVHKLEVNPNYPDSIFAASRGDIMLSVDGGINWNSVCAASSQWSPWVDIEFMPGNTNVIYAALRNDPDSNGVYESNVYRSNDGGDSWININNGFLPDRSNVEIAVTNANPNVIYALFADGDDYHGLYKSNDMGDNWILQSDTPNILIRQGWYNLSIAVDPTNESNVWVGGVVQRSSVDNGQSWNYEYGVHADQHYAEFNPLNNTLFVANDGGVYKYVNNNFLNISDDLRITQFYRLGLSSTNPDKLVGGTQDNGTMMLHNGSFVHIAGGDGMECIIDKFNENKIFSSSQYGNLRRCDDISISNYTWNYIKPVGTPLGAWVTPYKLHPMNNNMIFVGYEQLYRSYDSGDNWDSISNFTDNGLIEVISIAPSNPDYIYLYKGWVYDTIMITKNGGVNWEKKAISFQSWYNRVSDIFVYPNNPEILWLTTSNWGNSEKVLVSLDAGDTWTDISGNNLPDVPVRCIVYQENAKGDLYVGTDLGVYHRDSTMNDWMPYMNGLPNVSVTELEIHYGSDKIRAATYGRGIWESNLNSSPLSLDEKNKNKKLVKITDILGRNINEKYNTPLLYIYDDGTVEKRIKIN